MSSTTEDIKARLSIVDVVGQYVRLTKAGAHYKANCPFHQEKTPSFMVNEERQMWHCFGCGKGGDVFAFIMEIEGLEFREALKLLAERAGVELPTYSKNNQPLAESKDRGLEIIELATKFYEKQLWESTGGKKVLDYLHDRGLSDDSICAFRLGFAPDGWRHLSEFLLSRGYGSDELEKVGLVIRKNNSQQSTVNNTEFQSTKTYNLSPHTSPFYDRFRNRIMFPIADILGRVVGYSARVAPGGDESQAKYINTPETNLYHKSRALYGIQLAKQTIKSEDLAVLVEGNLDVIAMHQAGIKNTVAVSGTALTTDQLSILKRYAKTVRLFFDMDEAGQAASWKSAEIALQAEFRVEIVALPFGKDAADMGKDNPDQLREAVKTAKEAGEYFLEALERQHDISTSTGKRAVAEKMAELLASMRNEIERSHWVKELSRLLATDERVILGVIEQLTKKEWSSPASQRNSTVLQSLSRKAFRRRSEALREAIIGFMLASKALREQILTQTGEVAVFLAEHPLFFFLRNASTDPLDLIEDKTLQQEASRLVFETLALPSIAETPQGEREAKMKSVADEYLAQLHKELTGKDQLQDLASAISDARKRGDKEEERRLLEEFAKLSQQR